MACIEVRVRRGAGAAANAADAGSPSQPEPLSHPRRRPRPRQPILPAQDLRSKREEVNRSILRDEEEKAKIQKELTTMTERLSRINEDLARKMQARNEFDQTIQETEAAYMKILESSQTLLNVLKREAINLQKKRGASS